MRASKLTDAQLEAAVLSSEATARKHEAAGNPRAAAQAWARATRNREELRRREGLMQDPPQSLSQEEAPAAAPPRIANAVVPDDAVRDAEAIAKRWGTAALVRACVAVLNTRTAFADSWICRMLIA